MSEIATGRVCITNRQGLHLRPADMFARTASQFQATIDVVKGGQRVDGKSVLSIVTLVAEQGTELSIEAKGPDAQEALRALVELVERGFEEESQQSTP